jgi:hypothetical protein
VRSADWFKVWLVFFVMAWVGFLTFLSWWPGWIAFLGGFVGGAITWWGMVNADLRERWEAWGL